MLVYPNAKINIGLFITQRRKDGFHNLESVFYPVPLSDILEVNQIDRAKGICLFENTGLPVDCPPEKNLVVRAYKLLALAYNLPAVEVRLHKVIPFGAGLGGGSSDAAHMLLLLNDYFGLGISQQGLMNYAARLGSDCAFFVKNTPVFAQGKGEILEDIALSLKDYSIVIVKPGCSVSTKEAYQGVNPRPAAFNLHGLPELPLSEWSLKISNDFEKSVFALYPEIKKTKEKMYRLGALYASMTGSGSAVFGIFEKGQYVTGVFEGDFVWTSESVEKG